MQAAKHSEITRDRKSKGKQERDALWWLCQTRPLLGKRYREKQENKKQHACLIVVTVIKHVDKICIERVDIIEHRKLVKNDRQTVMIALCCVFHFPHVKTTNPLDGVALMHNFDIISGRITVRGVPVGVFLCVLERMMSTKSFAVGTCVIFLKL